MGRSTNVRRPKFKVKLNFSSIRSRALPILQLIDAGNYPAKIGRVLGLSKSHVFYYVHKLEQAGLLVRRRRSSIVVYEVTHHGTNFLTGSEGVLSGSGVWRLHAAKYHFPLDCDGAWPVDWRRVAKMNWTALLGLEGGVTVERTPSSVIVHVETLYGKDPMMLLDLARGCADRTARALVQKYGCRLGEGKLCRRPHIAVDDPVAEFISRYFELSAENCKVDASEGVGEIDHFTIESAVEYLRLPETTRKISGQVDLIGADVDVIKKDLSEVKAFLTKLCGDSEPKNGVKPGGDDYVA
jgi:predicted transcriptional regulator